MHTQVLCTSDLPPFIPLTCGKDTLPRGGGGGSRWGRRGMQEPRRDCGTVNSQILRTRKGDGGSPLHFSRSEILRQGHRVESRRELSKCQVSAAVYETGILREGHRVKSRGNCQSVKHRVRTSNLFKGKEVERLNPPKLSNCQAPSQIVGHSTSSTLHLMPYNS
jgi:hypothetical protein